MWAPSGVGSARRVLGLAVDRFRWVAEAPRAREEAEDLRRSGPGGRRCCAALAGGGAAHHAQPEGAGERSDLHTGPSTSVSTLGDRRQQKVSGRNSTPRSHTPLNATKPFDEQWI